MWGMGPCDRYDRLLHALEAAIIDAIRDRPDEFRAENRDDMWDWYDRAEDGECLEDEDEER